MLKKFNGVLTLKRISSVFLVLCIFFVLALSLMIGSTSPVHAAEEAYIFNITTTCWPNDVLYIQGSNFGSNPQVWFDRIEDSNDKPNPETQATTILSKGDNIIQCLVPSSLSMGLYAVFVDNGNEYSEPAYVNRAQAWELLNVAGTEIDPGRTFEIYGTNLDFSGSTPSVRFKKVSDGTYTKATVTDRNDRNFLQVTAPSDLVAGQQYDIYVNNGYGGEEVLEPRITARASGTDSWGIGVPWGSEFSSFYDNVKNVKNSPYNAAGDGITDDSTAIQDAIIDCAKEGGGVVYLPTGTYNISTTTLLVPSKVVIKGDGVDASGNYLSKITKNTRNKLIDVLGNRVGFVDICLEAGPSVTREVIKAYNKQYLFFLRSRIDNNSQNSTSTLKWKDCNNFVVRDSKLYQNHRDNKGKHILISSSKDVWIYNNYIQWKNNRIWMAGMTGLQVNDNEFYSDTDCDQAPQGEHTLNGGPYIARSDYVALYNNLIGKIGDGQLLHRNDREAILTEPSGEFVATGKATGGSSNTLVDTTESWTSNQLAGMKLVITKGPGMGQERTISSNTSTTITISGSWNVEPTSSSYYTVFTKYQEYVLISGNTLNDQPRGIWLYFKSMKNCIVTGNTLNDSESIFLRADQRAEYNAFSVQKNMLIENNVVKDTKKWYPARIIVKQAYVNGSEHYGNSFYNIYVRGNTVQAYAPNDNHEGNPWSDGAPGEGYFAHVSYEPKSQVDNNTAGVMGVVFLNNTAKNTDNAFFMDTGSYNNVIYNTTLIDVANLLWDKITEPDGTHASVDTSITESTSEPETE